MIEEYFRDPWACRDDVWRSVCDLEPDALRRFGYDYYYMNMRGVFRDRSPEANADTAARALRHKLWCGWDVRNRWIAFLESGDISYEGRLSGWDFSLVDALLRKGTGALLCTLHFGAFRDVVLDLVGEGYPMTVALDSDAAPKVRNLGGGRPVAAATTRQRTHVRVVDVESDPAAGLRLTRALRRNDIVFVMIDGNSGRDGPHGRSNRTIVDLLGYRVAVKSGVLGLARATNSPILSAVTHEDDNGTARVDTALLAYAGRPDAEVMQELYGRFEPYLRRYPEQWEGANQFHRWRLPGESRTAGPALVAEEVELARRTLTASSRLLLERSRSALIRRQGACVLVDVLTLAAYRILDTDERLQVLLQAGSVDVTALRGLPAGDQTDSLLPLLGRWLRNGLIRPA